SDQATSDTCHSSTGASGIDAARSGTPSVTESAFSATCARTTAVTRTTAAPPSASGRRRGGRAVRSPARGEPSSAAGVVRSPRGPAAPGSSTISTSTSSAPGPRTDVPSAAGDAQLGLAQLGTEAVVELARVEPAVGQHGPLGRAGAAARPLGGLAGVRLVEVELGEQLVEVRQALDETEPRPELTAHDVALEVPGHVLAHLAQRLRLVAEVLDHELGVPPDH